MKKLIWRVWGKRGSVFMDYDTDTMAEAIEKFNSAKIYGKAEKAYPLDFEETELTNEDRELMRM